MAAKEVCVCMFHSCHNPPFGHLREKVVLKLSVNRDRDGCKRLRVLDVLQSSEPSDVSCE
jgi:hypothetical protein